MTNEVRAITSGPVPAKVMVIGERPGYNEISQGRPMAGWAGHEFDLMLAEAGLNRSDVFVTNVAHEMFTDVRGQKEGGFWKAGKARTAGRYRVKGKYPVDEVLRGMELLPELIERVNPDIIVPTGAVALWAITGLDSVTKWRGSIIEHEGRKVIPTFNPALVIRQYSQRWITVQDFRRVARELRREDPRKVYYPKRDYIVRPDVDTVLSFLDEATSKQLVGDIETRGGQIACMGISVDTMRAICIPFMSIERHEGYWSAEEELEIVLALRKCMTHPETKMIWHNGAYDVQYICYQWGFLPSTSDDTMLMQHVAFPGMRKALDYVASMYCDYYKYWKDDSKEWNPKHHSEDQIWIYNCLMKGTGVITEHGTKLIEDIVRNKLQCKVLTMNESTGSVEWKPIVGWHRTVQKGQKWIRVGMKGRDARKGIVCTPDHEIITTSGRKEAKDIVVGDLVFMPEQAYSNEYLGALVGTLLGDSSFATTSNKSKSVVTCTQVSLALINEKIRLFGGTVTSHWTKPNKFTDKYRRMHRWSLSASRQIELLRQVMCHTGKREATDVLEYLTPLGIALWYVDDGFMQKGHNGRSPTAKIALQGFDDKESIRAWFEGRYGKCSVTSQGNLVFTVGASKMLCEEISKYVIPAMRYKLPYPEEDYTLTEIEEGHGFIWEEVESNEPFDPSQMSNYGYANIRYCLTVQDNHNFMTTDGLVRNCDDCCYSYEVYNVLCSVLKAYKLEEQYDFQMSLFTPVLFMMLRGILVDQPYRNELNGILLRKMGEVAEWFEAVLGHSLNPDDNHPSGQMRKLFYDDLKIKPVKNRKTGQPSLDKNAFEQLRLREPILRPLIDKVEEYRSYRVFRSNFILKELDPDGRMRSSITIPGTETFRFSSSENPWGRGANMQTISKGTEKD